MNTCAWCGSSIDDHKTIWIRKNLLIGYPFCSNKCSSGWKQNKDNDSNKSRSETRNDNDFSDDFLNPLQEKHEDTPRTPKSFDDVLLEARVFNDQRQIERDKQAEIEKADKEFYDNLKKNWKLVLGGVIIVVICIGVYGNKKEISKQNDINISQQLEQIEDKVRLSIQSGDKEKALNLTNQLIHPSHENMETQKFDTWTGYPKYDEYWTKKRENYKEEIMKLKN